MLCPIPRTKTAISIIGVLFLGVLVAGALVFGVYIRAANVWELPSSCCRDENKSPRAKSKHFVTSFSKFMATAQEYFIACTVAMPAPIRKHFRRISDVARV